MMAGIATDVISTAAPSRRAKSGLISDHGLGSGNAK
jgi:hypothetical protein